MDQAKRCPKCGETKPLEGFFKDRARYDGRGVYCAPCHTAVAKRSLLDLRLSVFDLLGGRACTSCGIEDVRVLVIDHLDGGGRRHRQDATSSYSLYRYVQKHPEEFQVLCFNCNHLARLERGESGKTYSARIAAATPREKVTRPLRWSRDFDGCRECGTTERRHVARGLCERCRKTERDRANGILPIDQATQARRGKPNPKVAESRRGTRRVYRDDGSWFWGRPDI